jgi:hypothetical protein
MRIVLVVLLFAALGEVRRAPVDDGLLTAESAHDELVMDLMADTHAWHLVEGWR